MSFPDDARIGNGIRPSKLSRFGVGSILVAGSVATLLVLGSCGRSAYRSYRAAEGAAARFHEQLDSGDYEDVYSEATDEFRNTGSRRQHLEFLRTVHEKMGNSGKHSVRGFHLTANTMGSFLSVVFRTEFASGPADEYFVWRMDQGQPRLWSYRINSPDLR